MGVSLWLIRLTVTHDVTAFATLKFIYALTGIANNVTKLPNNVTTIVADETKECKWFTCIQRNNKQTHY